MKWGISEAIQEANEMMDSFQKDADYFKKSYNKTSQRYCEGQVDGLSLFIKVLEKMEGENNKY